MPSYPIAFPVKVAPENVRVRRRTAAAVSESPTTYQQQVYQHPGARFEIEVKLQPMAHDDARAFTQFFYDLAGRVGTFNFDLTPHCPGLLIGGVVEVFTVDFTGLTPAGLANKYLTAADADGAVYAWFRLDGAGADPAPGGRGIVVPISTGQTAAQLAAAFAAALNADRAFTAAAPAAVATVTNVATGDRTNAAAGTSGAAVATTQAGAGTAPGVREFRLADPEVGWDSDLARTFGFTFRAVEKL